MRLVSEVLNFFLLIKINFLADFLKLIGSNNNESLILIWYLLSKEILRLIILLFLLVIFIWILSNLHSFLISSLTLAILFFIFKPTLILNTTQLLAISLIEYE